MLKLLKKKVYPIGVDLGTGFLRMAQLGFDGEQVYLNAAACEAKPDSIAPGGPDWQRWAAQTIHDLSRRCGFKGKSVVTTMCADSLFIDEIKIPRTNPKKIAEVAMAKAARRLPFDPKGAAIKHVVLEAGSGNGEMNLLIMAADRTQVDRHLAIYETAQLDIHSICVWPQAMVNSYVTFFSRRQHDDELVALLLDLGSNHTNVVICKQAALYFARVIPMGFNQITAGQLGRLIGEIDACCRYFDSVAGGIHVQRVVFLAPMGIDRDICNKVAELAQRMQVPAQMGDVFSAVPQNTGCDEHVDRRDNRINWTNAFGLSLAEAIETE